MVPTTVVSTEDLAALELSTAMKTTVERVEYMLEFAEEKRSKLPGMAARLNAALVMATQGMPTLACLDALNRALDAALVEAHRQKMYDSTIDIYVYTWRDHLRDEAQRVGDKLTDLACFYDPSRFLIPWEGAEPTWRHEGRVLGPVPFAALPRDYWEGGELKIAYSPRYVYTLEDDERQAVHAVPRHPEVFIQEGKMGRG